MSGQADVPDVPHPRATQRINENAAGSETGASGFGEVDADGLLNQASTVREYAQEEKKRCSSGTSLQDRGNKKAALSGGLCKRQTYKIIISCGDRAAWPLRPDH